MESFNLLLDLAYEIGFGIVMNFFTYGAVSALVGFISTIIFVRYLNKNGHFNRAFGLWTFLAKLNMVYLPIVSAVAFGVIGGTYGLNAGINGYIESAVNFSIHELNQYISADVVTATIAEYGTSYLITDVVDTAFWFAYRGLFILFFFTLIQWPIIEFVIHKIFSFLFGSPSRSLQYTS